LAQNATIRQPVKPQAAAHVLTMAALVVGNTATVRALSRKEKLKDETRNYQTRCGVCVLNVSSEVKYEDN
jgi:hypothetical protein